VIGRPGYGTTMTDQSNPPQTGDPKDLLGLDEASELLGVQVEQVRAMADQGLITRHDTDDGPAFQRAELIAARDVGG
jgi:hypothetical protein